MKIQWKFNTVKFELQGEIGELTWPYPPQKIIFNKHSLLNKTVSCYNKTRIGYGLDYIWYFKSQSAFITT